jgi:hypothetical protein
MSAESTMEDLVDSSIDWSSSDSDESDLDELLHEEDTETMLLILAIKELEGHARGSPQEY